MRSVAPDSIDVLARLTTFDAGFGASIAWLCFTPLTATAFALMLLLSGPPGIALIGFIVAFLMASVFAGVVAFAWGIPTGFLIARLLRPIRNWQLHLIAQVALGAVTGLLVWLLGNLLLPREEGSGFINAGDLPYIIGAVVLTAISVGLGWTVSWRRAIRRSRISPAGQDIEAVPMSTDF